LIETMIENLDKATNARSACNKAYWNEIGESIEKKARIVCPMVYLFVLVVMFNLDMRDHYATTTEPMFSGITKNISIRPNGVGMILAFVIVVIVGLTSTHFINKSIAKAEEELKAKQKQASRQVASEVAQSFKKSTAKPTGMMSRLARRSREMISPSRGSAFDRATETTLSADEPKSEPQAETAASADVPKSTETGKDTVSTHVTANGTIVRRTRRATSSNSLELASRVDELSTKLDMFQSIFQAGEAPGSPRGQAQLVPGMTVPMTDVPQFRGVRGVTVPGFDAPQTDPPRPAQIVVPPTPGSTEVPGAFDLSTPHLRVFDAQYDFEQKEMKRASLQTPSTPSLSPALARARALSLATKDGDSSNELELVAAVTSSDNDREFVEV